MKKKIIGIFVCMLMIGSVIVGAGVSENGERGFFDIEDSTVSVTIPVGSYEIESTEQGDEIHVENFGRLLIPGKPDLPSKIFSIAIPPGAEVVDVSFEVFDSVAFPGSYDVLPVPLPRAIGQEDPFIYEQEQKTYEENYNAVYRSDESYPSSVVEFIRPASYRKYNLVDVRVNPLTYYPLSGQLIYYPEVEVHISYTSPEGFSYDEIMIDNIPRAEQLAKKIIYNYEQAKDWYPKDIGGRDSYNYVIITLDSLTSKVTPLVDWEEAKGKNVYVATTDWIESNYDGWDLAEKMRNFLRDKYPSEKWGILDVCLIGSYDDVPMRLTAQNVGYGRPETDYYYAELSKPDSESWDKDGDHQYGEDSDPIDFYAEVNVGRIPWSNADTVKHICEKSAAYEQNNDPAFKKNILLIGTFFWPDTDNAVLMETKTDPDDHPWMEDWTKTTMYEEAQSSYPCDYDVSYQNVKNVWSSGTYAFVDWAGHGSPTACYEYYPSQAFVDTQTCNYLNDDYPAIVFADACSNSDTDYLNIGQAMLKQGAIGFLGATKVAYGMPGWSDPYSGSSQSLDYFFTTCCTSGDYTQGQGHQWALLEMYTNNLWYYTRFEMFEWGSLWGNPDLTMGVVSLPPETPTKPDGPEEWPIDEEATFTSTTTDPEEDSIYFLFDWGDGTDSGWVGSYASGQTGQADHIWTEFGEYEIKVMAKDVYNARSEWSESAFISIVPNNPPNKPIIAGPKNGKPKTGYTYTIISDDTEGHDIYYIVTWGDGSNTGWIGPYSSGEEIEVGHAWGESGSYTINARAKDIYGTKSDWGTFKISISKNKVYINSFFFQLMQRLLERFPMLKQILPLLSV